MIKANYNSFIHNTGLTEENSLVHLLDTLSPLEDNEADVIDRPGTIHLTHDSIRFDYYTCNSIRFHSIRFDYIYLEYFVISK